MANGTVSAAPLEEVMRQADTAYAAGDWPQAEKLCEQVLSQHAAHVGALSLLGIIKAQTRQSSAAATLLGRVAAALPDDPVAHNNYANVLRDLQRYQEAVDSYDRAIVLAPGYAEAHNNRGAALMALKRADAALDSYASAISLRPDYAEAHYNRGVMLHEVGRVDEALESYARAVALQPRFAAAHYNQGIVLQGLRRVEAAMRSYRAAVQANDSFAAAHNNLGAVLRDLGSTDEALDCLARALQINPTLVEAHMNLGHTYTVLMQPEKALASYDNALRSDPERPWLYGARVYTKLQLCDWVGMPELLAGLAPRVEAGQQAIQPLVALAVSDDLRFQRRVAEITAAASALGPPPVALSAPRRGSGIIRLGYYSADFHSHATAHLAAGLFELHDRAQFEVVAFSFGPDRSDPMRQRLLKAFDKFIEVSQRSDREVAQLSRDLGIDIAVDLKGYTRDARPGIFRQRAAPLQVNYLGFPGTMAADYIDYIIADAVLIPEASRGHYSEKIVYLPNSYQVNDRNREPAAAGASRARLGLPAGAFVFCSFNSPYKITAAVFDAWMRILKQVPSSVLWLYADNEIAAANLRREAVRREVDGARLVFATPVPQAQHLARHAAADLFLDTFPYAAHTTASDALWAGLPVLTRRGESFQSRVPASLLPAIGLADMVTDTEDQYEALAIALANDPPRMAAIRSRLRANRLTTPLFNTALYTRQLEQAYRQMHQRHLAGLMPADISIDTRPGATLA
jgi:predicted O-linked N-acetylglucosamine transferase (SPINDLY family)